MKKNCLFLLALCCRTLFAGAQTFSGAGGTIPDNNTQQCFPLTVSGVGNLTNTNGLVQVCLDITHTSDADLDIYLKAPNGSMFHLSTDNGSIGDNYTNTCFTATATTSITNGFAPFNGNYRPEQSFFSVNNGQNGNGTWQLCITDDQAGSGPGTLNSWSLTFGTPPPNGPPPCIANPAPADLCANATPICNLDGFCGNTSAFYNADTWFGLLSSFCGSIENNSWLRFTASSTSISFNVWVFNSQNGNGIQIMVMNNVCSGSVTSHYCNGNMAPTGTTPVAVVVNGLTIGTEYYIMIDGYGGDVCDYVIDANYGFSVLQITPSAPTVCAGQSVSLTASGGSTGYSWSPSATLNTATGATVTATPAVTTTYTVYSQTTLFSCPDSAKATVTVTPAPLPPVAPSPVSYCKNAPAVPLTATGTGLLWYTTPTGGTGSSTAPTPTTSTPGTTTYYVSQTANGCESPRTAIDVVVKPVYAQTTSAQICPGGSYQFGTQTITAAGTYNNTFTASNGCDSAVTLTVTMNSYIQASFNASICQGQTYTFNGIAQSTSGSYNDTFATAGCDSISTLVLTVNPLPTVGVSPAAPAICAGQSVTLTASGASSYSWSPATGLSATTGAAVAATPTATTTYTVTGTNASSCSNTATATVTVNPIPAAPTVTSPVSYCQNAAASPLTASGTNLLWYPSATGGTGSSTAPTPSTTTPGTTTYYVSQTANGCESPRTAINVVVKPVYAQTTSAQICPGGSYQFGTQTITAAGTYTHTFTTSNGCDSVVTLTVTVNSYIQASFNAAICQGQTYTFNGIAQSTSGSYNDTFATAGCDSISTLVLTVHPLPAAPAATSPVTYCQNAAASPLTASGTNLLWYTSATGGTGSGTAPTPSTSTPGTTTYYVSQTTNGCESPRTPVDVIVKPKYTQTTSAQICPGGSYQFGTQTITAAGTYTHTFTAANGCDSVVTLTMTMNSYIQTSFNASICQGQTYTFNGIAQSTSGSYNDTFATAGCDSISTLVLTVHPLPTAPTVTSPVTYCQNAAANPLTASGTNLLWYTSATGGTGSSTAPTPPTTTPGTTTYYVSQTANGCESPRTAINVVVKPVYAQTTSAQICPGGYYQFGTQTITAAGTYTHTFTASNGCDSVVTLTMTMNSYIQTSFNVSICQGQTYTFNSIAQSTSGSYNDTFATAGCDSISTLVLTVHPLPAAPTATSPVTYCQNAAASPLTASGTNLLWYTSATGGTGSSTAPTPSTTTPGTTTYYVSQTANGCESPRTPINVVVKPKYIQATSAQICPGGSYQFGTQTITAAGTYTHTFTAANGCDSVVTLTITMNSYIQTSFNASICQGQTYTFNGIAQSTSGSYNDTFATASCDSISTLVLTVNPLPAAPAATSPVNYCQNAAATPLTATGTGLLWYTVPTGGTGSSTAPTPATATPGTTTYYVSQTTNNCEGTRAAIQVIVSPIPSAPTADSIVTYCQNATAIPLTASGTGLLWYTTPAGGTGNSLAPTPSTTTPGTTNYYVSQTVNGCESSRKSIVVVVNPTPATPAVVSPVTYCQDATAGQLTASGNNLLWYTTPTGGNGSNTAPTPATAVPGTTTWYVSQTINGCESPRAAIGVVVNPTPAPPTVTSPVIYCQNDPASPLTASGTGLLWYTDATGGTGNSAAPTPVTAAIDTVNYFVSQSINGCEGARTHVQVIVYPNPVVHATLVPAGSVLYLDANASNAGLALNYLWAPPEGLSCTNCPRPEVNPQQTTTYTVTVSNTFGCKASDTITVAVDCEKIFLPNTFTPNGDGNNDRFYPLGKSLKTITTLKIYSRWGELVYEAHNLPPGQDQYGWDGSYKKAPLKADVYVYVLEGTCTTGAPIFRKGDVTLFR